MEYIEKSSLLHFQVYFTTYIPSFSSYKMGRDWLYWNKIEKDWMAKEQKGFALEDIDRTKFK